MIASIENRYMAETEDIQPSRPKSRTRNE